MGRYIIRRLFQGILTFLGISVIVFVLGRVTGDPVTLLAPESATEAQKQEIRQSLGLADPIPTQYWRFISGAVRGDFGRSYVTKQTVGDMLSVALPNTLKLAVPAFLLAVLLSIPIGVLVALKRNSAWALLGHMPALVGPAIPTFWPALTPLSVFGVPLKLLPICGTAP